MGAAGNDAQALFAHIGQCRVIGHIVREPPAAMEPETDECLIFKFIFAPDLPQEEQIRGSICFDLSFRAFTRLSFPRGPRIPHVSSLESEHMDSASLEAWEHKTAGEWFSLLFLRSGLKFLPSTLFLNPVL